ncbi:unnamed protein product [Eruca vesicaria subsp. sativa]|uniref:Uncharacterized protein n=1 Tax=Eruca vesicaria subsp. sativa TaxID=29727 RepID=A0ABC8KWI7_ERUVS|nr:unnamed protein product [Eruca vesicaria subsp. sativa]
MDCNASQDMTEFSGLCSLQHTSVGPPPQSTTGFTMGSSMQPNMLDRRWMAVSAPFQQGRKHDPNNELFSMVLEDKRNAIARPNNPKNSHRSCIEKNHKPDTLKRLNMAVRFKNELEQKEYSDLRIGLFKEKKYHDVGRHYPEAIKRNPEDLRAKSFLIILCASVL